MTLTLQLPVPSPRLRSNGSFGKAFVYREAFRAAKLVGEAEAWRVLNDLQMQPPRWAQARYVATQFHATPQHLDPDNFIASLKAYIDAIASVGIVVNDKHFYPERPRFVRVDRMPRVELQITPEDPTFTPKPQ